MTDAGVRILVLDSTHRVLDGAWRRAPDLATGTATVRAEGVDASSPVGNRPPLFALLSQGNDAPGLAPDRWVPHGDAFARDPSLLDAYAALLLGGWRPPDADFDVFHFGAPGFMASQLAHLVAKGNKRGTASWLASHLTEDLPLPRAGRLSVVTDGFGIPVCAVRTDGVERLRFRDVTPAMARAEGEGDLSLENWKRGHWAYWTTHESPAVGIPFTEESEILFETFTLVKVFGS